MAALLRAADGWLPQPSPGGWGTIRAVESVGAVHCSSTAWSGGVSQFCYFRRQRGWLMVWCREELNQVQTGPIITTMATMGAAVGFV